MSDPRPSARIVDPETLRRYRLEHLGEPCHVCERRPGAAVHHRLYRSRGGDDVASNCVWVCHACHRAIHDDGLVL